MKLPSLSSPSPLVLLSLLRASQAFLPVSTAQGFGSKRLWQDDASACVVRWSRRLSIVGRGGLLPTSLLPSTYDGSKNSNGRRGACSGSQGEQATRWSPSTSRLSVTAQPTPLPSEAAEMSPRSTSTTLDQVTDQFSNVILCSLLQ